jgi:hypothetical protein
MQLPEFTNGGRCAALWVSGPQGTPAPGSASDGWGPRYPRPVKLRLGQTDLDPRTVPLPAGTEVSTRVDRVLGDRVVPQGAVGKVAGAADDGWIEVEVVGVGRVRYARDELQPRKLGQLRYAVRRAAGWEALRSCAVLETVVGSRAWGLADEGSDTDVRGVFVLPMPWTAGLVEAPQDLTSLDGSRIYWEAGKAIRQAVRADPYTLETLFVAGARALDPIGAWLLEAREAFVSIEIYGSFGRYALSQLEKLHQQQRLARHRSLLIGWLRAEPRLSLDQVAARLAGEARIQAPSAADAELRAKEYVKQLYGSLYDQGLLERRDFAALVELAGRADPELATPRELRPKNAYNLLRLIDVALRWLRTGAADFVVTGEFRERLLAIKRGQVPLEEVLDQARAMMPALEQARRESALPPRADVERADALLHRIREEAARRHVTGAPGPLGAGAPPPPLARWEEEG